MKKLLATTIIILISSHLLIAQLSGTRNVPSENYPDFQSVVDSLNLYEVNAGGITFEMSGDLVFNHSPLIISGSGSSGNPINIQWNQTGAKPILNIEGTIADAEAGITLLGTDYMTIDGIAISTENGLLEYGLFLSNASINNACQHNVFQNLDINLNKTNSNQTIGINVLTEEEPTFSEGIHADNKFFNNTVQNCIIAYNFDSGTGDVSFMGFDNEVGAIDDGISLISDISLCGVYLKGQNGAKVHHTQIIDLERIGTGSTAPAAIATTSSLPNELLTEPFEIHDNIIDNHHSAITSIFGFYLNARKSEHLIYNNIINNISATGGGSNTATGIMLFGTDITATIYNNMVSDIAAPASSLSGSPAARGIELRSFNEAFVLYNSVQLDYTATNSENSSAALFVNNDDEPVTLKNNILINLTSLTSPSTGLATAFYKSTTTLVNITNETSNNLYFSDEPSESHPIFYAYSSSSPLIGETLEDYQALVVDFDQIAFTGQVSFIDDLYLYVNNSDVLVRENAIPIDNPISITEDIEGQERSLVNPDLGADELAELLPTTAVNPNPADLSTDVSITQVALSWDYLDDGLFAIPAGFKVFLNDSDDFSGLPYYWIDFEEEQDNYYINISDILDLEYDMDYFWKVIPITIDEDGQEAEGVEVWTFATESSVYDFPNLAECVSPVDGELAVAIDLETLMWSFSLETGYSEPFGFKVYFGTDTNLGEEELLAFVEYQAGEDNYSINPSTEDFSPETIYYWKVVPVAQSETGVENPNAVNWQFTTEQNTSIETISQSNSLIYPNPVSDFISIYIKEECELSVYSLSGIKVYSKSEQKGQVLIPVDELKPGVYFLTFQNMGNIISERFIVE
ncbi:T9SS type A sorting domain-containing protein [Lentimicrobium sp. L6]|uniref:T9SS type A sorting domain-containing protein n=1 Tax=Lentimicrobium sp. L6 TaxID=2735916 RepID=UPI0015533ABD|nr:T9SS type A sorting domain-containing protein [Lentimicrobium sp. L6]NPD86824.1 T9SS type A sorting domain-containing protein [Lentimicrobium sp. L6]